jgi:hydrogenase maturation protease
MTAPPPASGRTVIIGIGNEFRRDDGAGPAVVARLGELLPPGVELTVSDGEPLRLIEAWRGASLAVVVDAVRAEPPSPGRLHRFELYRPGPATANGVSSHGMGLDEAIRLALALERMPARLILHAVEVADVSQGIGLTPAVAAATNALVSAVLGDLAASGVTSPVR